jgi:hypothetical protein
MSVTIEPVAVAEAEAGRAAVQTEAATAAATPPLLRLLLSPPKPNNPPPTGRPNMPKG